MTDKNTILSIRNCKSSTTTALTAAVFSIAWHGRAPGGRRLRAVGKAESCAGGKRFTTAVTALMDKDGLSFVQISDSHIGFNKEANQDVIATLQVAVAQINALPTPPAFLFHTGDLSHLSRPDEFDTLDKILQTARADRVLRPGRARHAGRQRQAVSRALRQGH